MRHQSRSLADYYADSGTPPCVFLGAGLAALDGGRGVEVRSAVKEEHLFNLLGMCADPITGQSLGRPPIRSRSSLGGLDAERREAICHVAGIADRIDPVAGHGAPERTLSGRTGRRWRGSTSRSRPASRSLRCGPWPMPTRRRLSPPAIAGPSRWCSPTPSGRSSIRARARTASSKKTLRASWQLPLPTGIPGRATPSSMIMWW